MPKGKRDYLFKRRGSENFWIKLRSPAGRVERSLGTSDRREAEVLALPLIAQHKAALLAARPRQETKWDPVLAPGACIPRDAWPVLEEHEDPDHVAGLKAAAEWAKDGGRIFATQRELHYLNSEGQTIRPSAEWRPRHILFW